MNRVAVITGGGTGIGSATAQRLVEDGWLITIAGRRRDRLEETASRIGADQQVLTQSVDVTDPESVQELFRATAGRFGRVDLLFNNAGTNVPAVPIEELSPEQWRAVVDTNLSGAFYCTQAAFRQMKTQSPQGGRIINNGSISSEVPRPHSAPYTATKHAIRGLTKSTSLDGRPFGIACGQIDIGNAETDMAAKMKEGVLQANGETAIEPTFPVRQVADAVAHMASLPLDTNVLFMTIMATSMPFVGRG